MAGINRDFFIEQHDVVWADKNAATVRGITPDDISRLLSSESANVEKIFNTMEGEFSDDEAAAIDPSDNAAVSAILKARAKPVVGKLLMQFPDLIAKVIATCCDDPDTWAAIKQWPAPLQMECLTHIARLTFVDAAGFQTFVGNVLALAQTMRRESAPAPQLRSVG